MTLEERMDHLENFAASWAEKVVVERAEDRALWRHTQEQLNELAGRMNALTDRVLDERISMLVSAIGAMTQNNEGPIEFK